MFDMFGLENDHKIAYGDEVVLLTTVYDVAMLGKSDRSHVVL